MSEQIELRGFIVSKKVDSRFAEFKIEGGDTKQYIFRWWQTNETYEADTVSVLSVGDQVDIAGYLIEKDGKAYRNINKIRKSEAEMIEPQSSYDKVMSPKTVASQPTPPKSIQRIPIDGAAFGLSCHLAQRNIDSWSQDPNLFKEKYSDEVKWFFENNKRIKEEIENGQ